MFVTRKSLDRRTLLRGLGLGVALPMLDAMTPAFAANKVTAAAPRRLAFCYVPNGIIMPAWTPTGEGKSYELSRVMQPLAAYRQQMLVLSGLAHKNGQALGDGPGDHARAAASFLTGVHPKKTEGADILLAPSVDQVAAEAIGRQTRFASLELGLESSGMVGNCDSGYSCAYSNSIAWRSATTPLPPEINPRAVFERLFGDGESFDPHTRAVMARQDKSILDAIRGDASGLQANLGGADKRKLEEYLYSLREIERRITDAEKQAASGGRDQTPSLDKPAGIPVTFEEHAKLMFDLQVAAMRADLTRVMTFMIGREGSNRTYRSIGVSEAHHGLSHHLNAEEKIEKITKINVLHAELFAYFLGQLAKTPDGDGTLLDHSMVVYGSGLSDGNRHDHHDLPVLVAGGGGGTLQGGRHIKYASRTPMTNLYLSLLDRMGVKPETIGDSTGRIEHLSL
ncbi:MAG: DUF1552 domain-containing protein [Bryobacteraceae bacterium]|nr:DUF1552 domain-containing protein [Bryobacteraceae bacterium]